jgi:uncharacterized protein YciI
MSTFAVTYTFSADPDEVNQIRPTHRVWLAEQLESGSLLASGPMVDRPAALLIFKSDSIEELNAVLRDASLNGDLVNQIYYSYDPELVSSDIIGNTCCSVFDSHATIVSNDGKNVVLYAWYDNEFGYTKQVIRLAKHVTKVQRAIYY